MLEVKRLRQGREWNQTELAFHAGLAPSVISEIENGKRDPSARTLRKLAEALEVDVADLFPKGQAPLPDFEGGRRLRYLRAWRAHLYRTLERWAAQPPTTRQTADLLDTMTALEEQGVFDTSDVTDSQEEFELSLTTNLLRQLNAIADSVEKDEEAEHRRARFALIQEKISA